jgi:hypothetical protein
VLKSLGLFSRWEVVGPCPARLTLPPPLEEEGEEEGEGGRPSEGAGAEPCGAAAAQQQREATRRHGVLVRGFAGGCLTVTHQVKAVRIEQSDGATISLERGAVATVEAHRCKRLLLRLHAPVAALCVDDCNDVTVELSWEARLGFLNELLSSDDASQPGFSVFSTGSHSVRVSYPLAAGPDAARVERVLPETLHTRFVAAAAEPRTSVVDRSRPWGDTPAATTAAGGGRGGPAGGRASGDSPAAAGVALAPPSDARLPDDPS